MNTEALATLLDGMPFLLLTPQEKSIIVHQQLSKCRKRRKEIIASLLSEDGKWYSPLGKPRCSMMPRGVWFCQVLAQENDIFSPWILVHLTVQFQRKETYFEQKKNYETLRLKSSLLTQCLTSQCWKTESGFTWYKELEGVLKLFLFIIFPKQI